MHITRLSLLAGSLEARGTVVVIDVFRAFTCEPLLYQYGVHEILLEADIEKCRAMQGNYLRLGECHGAPIEGFDLDNSPTHIMAKGHAYFSGKTIIHRTTAGVQGTVNAVEHADEVFVASFVNARATAMHLRARNPEEVSIVAMGYEMKERAPEDEYCGDYIESLLTGGSYDHLEAIRNILSHKTAWLFLSGDHDYLPREDPAICLQRDLFPFAIKVERRGDLLVSRRMDVPPDSGTAPR